MITSFAGRWTTRCDVAADRRVRALAARRGEGALACDPFLLAGFVVSARSPAGCVAVVAGRVSELVGGDGAEPARWLATAFERDGLHALQALRGEFIAVVWDPRRREGAIARDQLGARCLHYHPVPGGVAFAEELHDLVQLLEAAPEPDRRTVVSLAARGLIPIGRSHYEGIHRLPPGHLLRLADGRCTAQRWWRPRYAGVRPGAPGELAERVDEALSRAVRRCTEGRAVAVMVSGGLDSSAVAATATGQAEDPADRPVAYSGVFPRHRATDESLLIDDLVAFLGIRSVRRVITGGSAVAGAVDHLARWGVPPASPNRFLWHGLLARARADGLEVLLGGEGGDEVFDVPSSLIADRLRRGRPLDAWRFTRRLRQVGPDARRRRVARVLVAEGLERALPDPARRLTARLRDRDGGTPAWVRQKDAPALGEDVEGRAHAVAEGPLWWRDHTYQLTAFRELLDAHGYLRRSRAEAGLDARHPFMHDVDLVETVLTLPPEPRLDPRHDRVLLRRALIGRIPDSIRLRRGKSHFTPLLADALDGHDGVLLRGMLADPGARLRAYTRPDRLDALVASRPQGSALDRAKWLLTMWRLGSLEIWLRSLDEPGWLRSCAERLPQAPADEFVEVMPGGASELRPFPA